MPQDFTNTTPDTATSRRRARRFGFLACSAVLIAGLGGYAYGTIPNSVTGVISACYVKSGTTQGALRIIDAQSGATCKATETAVSWNSKGINDRGAWSSTTVYIRGDAVLYAGQTYLAKIASKAVVPTNTTSWQLLAARGATGPTGPTAPAGPQGYGFQHQYVVEGIGENDVPGAPSFVAPANASCVVTTTVQQEGNNLATGAPIAEVVGSISANGAPYVDDGAGGIDLTSNGVNGEQSPVTVTSVFSVTAGETVQFGASYHPWQVETGMPVLRVRQGYICS
jgi:hypothetical protein